MYNLTPAQLIELESSLAEAVHDRTVTVDEAVEQLMLRTGVTEGDARMILARALGAKEIPGVEDALTPLPEYGL